MKRFTLDYIQLINFKGIRESRIDFKGSTSLYGMNGIGKSTYYSAWLWLLTGKDEFDRADSEIKNTVDTSLNTQAHEVEAKILVDGKAEVLKRVYLEKWVKPSGKTQKEFSGHKTDYYFNDVPCSAAEYKAKVDALIPANLIKMLTNPAYFVTLPWEKQRAGLLSIAGKITDEMILDQITTPENDYGTLALVLNGGKSAEEWKREISAKKGLLKKAAAEFKPRIEELKNTLPETEDWKELEAEQTRLKGEVDALDAILQDASAQQKERQKKITDKNNELWELQNKLKKYERDLRNTLEERHRKPKVEANLPRLQRTIKDKKAEITRKQNEIDTLVEKIADYNKNVSLLEQSIESHRAKWTELNNEKFEFSADETICPACKQPLPAEKVEASKTQMQADFNARIKRRKDEQVEGSDQDKKQKGLIQDNITAFAQQKIDLESDIEKIEMELDDLDKEVSAEMSQEPLVEESTVDIDEQVNASLSVDDKHKAMKSDIADMEAEINNLETNVNKEDGKTENRQKKAALQTELDEVVKKLGVKDSIDRTKKRIKELKDEEKVNSQALADLESNEFQVETYTRAKMDILQNRVNKMFDKVTWKLFEPQVNGEIAETCVALLDGVPYPTQNTASKMWTGLEIINTLQGFYELVCPVFLDNRESTFYIPKMQAQVISLYASQEDKTLRIEEA